MNSKSNNSLKTELSDLIGKYYPLIELRILFLNNNSVGGYFNQKDRIPDLMNSNIVHKYQFPQCSEIYVGKVPDICTHVLLNIGVCLLVLVSLVVTLKAIYANIFLDSGHVVSPSAFSILYSENISSFTVIESIYIHKYFGPVCGWVSQYVRLSSTVGNVRGFLPHSFQVVGVQSP